jgi:hypothetical protein
MTQYTWQLAFDRLKEQGPQRIVTLFKIGLQEIPRLEKSLLNSTKQDQDAAAKEVRALFGRIHLELTQAISDSRLSPEEFIKQVRINKNFTPEEWERLSRVPELIDHHHKELFANRAFNTPKKRGPFFKV